RVPRGHHHHGQAPARTGAVGAVVGHRPLRHHPGPRAPAALHRRADRLHGGAVLRVGGHHPLPLHGGLGPGQEPVQPGAGAALPHPVRLRARRGPDAGDGRELLHGPVRRGQGQGRRQPGAQVPDRDGFARRHSPGGPVEDLRGARLPPRRPAPDRPGGPHRGPHKPWAPPSAAEARFTPKKSLPAMTVTNIKSNDDSVSFDVSQPGVPVMVKTSYFPNWQATGAKGPWRATPNMMVVVPTGTHVSLHYGRTPVDWAGTLLTVFGLLGLAGLANWKLVPLAPLPPRRRVETVGAPPSGPSGPPGPD